MMCYFGVLFILEQVLDTFFPVTSISLRYIVQALTPSVVPSAVSTVTMICITVFQNSLFLMMKKSD